MKKISMVKLLSLCLVIILSFTIFTSIGSANNDDKLKNLCQKYNLKDIDKAPNGITPIKFESIEEAEKFINKMKNARLENKVQDIRNSSEIEAMSIGSRSVSTTIGFLLYLNLYVQYTYLYDPARACNYYASVNSVTTGITGLTLGFDWRPNSTASYGNITNNGLNLSAHGEGWLDCYLLIEGLIKLWTNYYTIDGSWTNP